MVGAGAVHASRNAATETCVPLPIVNCVTDMVQKTRMTVARAVQWHRTCPWD